MTEWYVNISGMNSDAAGLSLCGMAIRRTGSAVEQIARRIPGNSSSAQQSRKTLRVLAQTVMTEAEQADALVKALQEISVRYAASEQRLLGNQHTIGSLTLPEGDAAQTDGASDEPAWLKSLLKLITAPIGPLGSLIMAIYGQETGSDKDFWKNILSLVGKEVKAAGKGKGEASWRDYILGNLFKTKTGEEITEDAYNKYNPFVKKDGQPDGIGRAAAIINILATLVGQGIENFHEQGGQINGRGIEETLSETAITIGKDILIMAGVGTAAAAIGVSAPAWLVSLTAAGIGLAVDWVGNQIAVAVTGDQNAKWLECVSDWALDTVINPVGDAVARSARWVSDQIQNAMDSVGRHFSNLFGSRCAWAT